MTQETLPDDVVVWVPEYNGHMPPHWRDKMPWDIGIFIEYGPTLFRPKFIGNKKYYVPREAVEGPTT